MRFPLLCLCVLFSGCASDKKPSSDPVAALDKSLTASTVDCSVPVPEGLEGKLKLPENSEKYERRMALHLAKFTDYPIEALRKGMVGQLFLRIRIDSKGHVLYAAPDPASSCDLLNKAMLKSVKRADPFPPPPSEYKGQMSEFIIPMGFYPMGFYPK